MASQKQTRRARTTTTTPADEPVLTLSSIVTRKRIRIDGTLYDLRNPDELPWLAYRHRAGEYQRAGVLLALKKRTKAQEQELDRLLPKLVAALVVAPASVLAKLSHEHQLGIVAVFFGLLMKEHPGIAAALKTTGRAFSPRTGAPSSRG